MGFSSEIAEEAELHVCLAAIYIVVSLHTPFIIRREYLLVHFLSNSFLYRFALVDLKKEELGVFMLL